METQVHYDEAEGERYLASRGYPAETWIGD